MPTLHTGFSSLAVDGYETDLGHGSEYRVDFVELTMNDYPERRLTENADEIRTLADEHDLGLVVHLPHGSGDALIGSDDDEVRERSVARMDSAIEAAGDIGARKAVLEIETDRLLLSETGRAEKLREVVSDLAETASHNGIEICIENLPGSRRRRTGPGDVARIAAATGTSVTLDTGHARTVGYQNGDIASFVAEHGEHISHFHLNDTRGPTDEHLPFGAGTVDFGSIFGALPEGWEGTATLEINTRDYEYIEVSARKLDELIE